MSYSGYLLEEHERARLLKIFPPKFSDVIAHHITYRLGDSINPPDVQTAKIVGYQQDESLECFVVELNGTTKRVDGKHYHITWSLDRSAGRKPADSNKLLSEKGYTDLRHINISVTPSVL